MEEQCRCVVCGSVLSSYHSLLGHFFYMRKINDLAHREYQNNVNHHKCLLCDFVGKRKSDVGNHIFSKMRCGDVDHTTFYNNQRELVLNLFEKNQSIGEILKNPNIYFDRAWINKLLKVEKANTKCPVCDKTFRDKVGLTSHFGKQSDKAHRKCLQKVGNPHYRKYIKKRHCLVPGCEHESVWLDRHMRMQIEQGDIEHIKYRDQHYKHFCPVCSKMFQSQQALIGHMHKSLDEKHQAFLEEQKQKIVAYFEAGLCIDEIVKQPDIIYSFTDGVYPIIHANFDKQEIHQRGRDKCGEKNKERILADPQAYFDRFLTARTKGSKPQLLFTQLLTEFLQGQYEVKSLDQDIFRGKEIDVTIPELKIAIEWQGPVHRKSIFGEKSLKNLQKSDKAKRTYFKRIGWQLIEIVDDNNVLDETFIKRQVENIVNNIFTTV